MTEKLNYSSRGHGASRAYRMRCPVVHGKRHERRVRKRASVGVVYFKPMMLLHATVEMSILEWNRRITVIAQPQYCTIKIKIFLIEDNILLL